MIAPALEGRHRIAGKVKVVKLNDENPNAAGFGVRSASHLMV